MTEDPQDTGRVRAQKAADIDTRLMNVHPLWTARQEAASCVERMARAWREIIFNWTAANVGLGDTPEEVEKWEDAMITAGEAIAALAEMIVE